MTPEAELIRALATGALSDIRTLGQGAPDPEKASDLASRHQVDALAWWMWAESNLNEVSPRPGLPKSLADRFHKAFLHHSLRNQSLLKDLTKLENALQLRNIDRLYLKGPWVAFQAYPHPGTRPIDDIDLCVRESQYLETVGALRAAGWKPAQPLPTTAQAALSRSHYRKQLRFYCEGGRPLELHFRLTNFGPPTTSEAWVWDTARYFQAGPCSLRVPGPEAMLLHLLMHANQHGFDRLRLLLDIRWGLQHDLQDLDFGFFEDRLSDLRCRTSCYFGLLLAQQVAGAAVPAALLEQLRPSALRRRTFEICWRLNDVRQLENASRPSNLEAPTYYLLEVGRVRHKLIYVLKICQQLSGRPIRLLRNLRVSRDPSLVNTPTKSISPTNIYPLSSHLDPPRHPKIRKNLTVGHGANAITVYDPTSDQTSQLNPAAASIFEMCDGTHTTAEIASDLGRSLSIDREALAFDIDSTIDQFLTMGILEPAKAYSD